MKTVGRPREFDEDVVLEAAMEAFWQGGYETTSLADLMTATGLQKGSLYKAFGDKHRLFLLAFQRYLDRFYERDRRVIEEAAGPKAGLQAWLGGFVEAYAGRTGPKGPQGCFAVNTVVERAAHDLEAREIILRHRNRQHRLIGDTVARAQAVGEIRSDLSVEALTSLLLSVLCGIFAAIKGPLDKQAAMEVVDTVFAVLA